MDSVFSKRIGKLKVKPGTIAFWVADFILPIAVFCCVLAWNNVYPFGSTTFLTEDLRYQYIDFFSWLWSVVHGEASLFYIPNQALGTDSWGLVSYYLSSPFNILIVFFDKSNLTDFVFLITALKLGCIQVSMTWYLKNRFGLRLRYAVILALCFTWSCWTATQLRNPLWLDVLILLPLACYGVYSAIRWRRLKLLVVTVTLAIITCWYTAYMLIVFLIIYTVLELIALYDGQRRESFRWLLGSCGLIAAALILALSLSAFTFLPTLMAMVGNTNVGITVLPEGALCKPRMLIASFFVGSWVLDHSPQFYAGTICLVLLVLFFVTKSIPARVKISAAALLLFLLASAHVVLLYYVWNGFREPNGFYCRITYLWVFAVIWCCSFAFKKLSEGSVSSYELAGSAIGCAVFAFEVWFLGWFEKGLYAGVTFVAIVLFVLAFFAIKNLQDLPSRRIATTFICLVMVSFVTVELAYNAHLNWKQLYNIEGQSVYDQYIVETDEQLGELRAKDSSIYRVERTYTRAAQVALNDGMARDYLQLSSYSSAHSLAAINFLNGLGYSNELEVHTGYAAPILLTDSLLGVKYVSDFEKPYGYSDVGLSPIDNGAEFYLNSHALSLAYGVSDEANGTSLHTKENVFKRQNAFISALLGRPVECYKPAKSHRVEKAGHKKSWSVEIPANSIGYAYVQGSNSPLWLSIDKQEPIRENWRFRHTITPIAETSNEPKDVSVSILSNLEGDEEPKLLKDSRCLFYYLDLQAFEAAMKELSAQQSHVSTWSGNRISCEYDADDSGWVLLTLPMDTGWTIKVNSSEVAAGEMYDGALTLVPVSQGRNEIELTYTPPGLVYGLCISLVSLVASIAVAVFLRNRRSKKNR